MNDNVKSTLNAQYLSNIFKINSGNSVVLKNIIFENVKGYAQGAVIYATNGNLTLNDIVIQNLNITQTFNTQGGLIFGKNLKFTINNFVFRNNVIKNGNNMYAGSFQLEESISIISNMEVYNNTVICENQIRGTIFTFDGGKASFENYTSSNGRYTSNNRFFFGTDIYFYGNELNITNFKVQNNTYDSKKDTSIEQAGFSIAIFKQCKFNMKNYVFTDNKIGRAHV